MAEAELSQDQETKVQQAEENQQIHPVVSGVAQPSDAKTKEEKQQIDAAVSGTAQPADGATKDDNRIQRNIWLHYWYGAIKDVDTQKGKFVGTVNIFLSWDLTDDEKKEYLELKAQNNAKQMDEFLSAVDRPILDPRNAIELNTLSRTRPKVSETYWSLQTTSTFTGQFEMDGDLRSFPFDVQRLYTRFRIENKASSKYRFLPFDEFHDPNDITNALAEVYPDCIKDTEFKLTSSAIECWEQIPKDGQAWYHCNLQLTLYVQRQWKHYLYQVMLITFALMMFVFPVFMFAVEAYGERLAHLTTLILAQVASLYVVNASLPKLPYLTILDSYILFGFAFTLLSAVESTIVKLVVDNAENDEVAQDVDVISCACFAAAVVLFHVWFAVKASRILNKNKNYLRSKLDFVPDADTDGSKVRAGAIHSTHKDTGRINHGDLHFRQWQGQSHTFDAYKL